MNLGKSQSVKYKLKYQYKTSCAFEVLYYLNNSTLLMKYVYLNPVKLEHCNSVYHKRELHIQIVNENDQDRTADKSVAS